MSKVFIPQNYVNKMDAIDTNIAIKFVKDTFQINLAEALNLTRVSAPLFVKKSSGLNDNLNGIENPVFFNCQSFPNEQLEIVHSLAKWKRNALMEYGFTTHHGLYTDMNAIRKDEVLDNIHSMYVDQWDWEQVIEKNDRTEAFFRKTVENIYQVILKVEHAVLIKYPFLVDSKLPEKIHFITSQELLNLYPDLDEKARENAICKQYGAVCLMQIGDVLSNGEKHDGRAPDYDDWQLNGDILVYNFILDQAFELSSMGIRVCEKSLVAQLEKSGTTELATLPYHQNIINKKLPYTIGGGIGQSRLCMYFLRKAHIGEVQSSLWDKTNLEICEQSGVKLL
ncbi:MAG: aspartate--ammonia ligase [Mycoplasmatales bacterium]